MSLWSDIGSFLHNTASSLFGGGSQPQQSAAPPPMQAPIQALTQAAQKAPGQPAQPPSGILARVGNAINQDVIQPHIVQPVEGLASSVYNSSGGHTARAVVDAAAAGLDALHGNLPGAKDALNRFQQNKAGAQTALQQDMRTIKTATDRPKSAEAANFFGNMAMGAESGGPEAIQSGADLVKNTGLRRPTPLSDAELTASQKVLGAHQGFGSSMDVTDKDAQLFHDAQKKLGANPGTPDGFKAVDDALGAHRQFNMQVLQRQQALKAAGQKVQAFTADHPVGLSTQAVDDEGNPVSRLYSKPRTKLTGKALETPNRQLASPAQIGHALGMSDEQIKAAGRVPELGPRPAVTPLETDAMKQVGMPTNGGKPPAPGPNPHDVSIPEVKPGNYRQARVNAQLASNPIEYRGGQAIKAIGKLSQDEKANFWDAVEHPGTNMSAAMKEAVTRWRDLADHTISTSNALGGHTPYIENYARHNWDLSNPEDLKRMQEIINARGGSPADPYDFGGLDRLPRVFDSVAEGKAAGFHLKHAGDPAQDVAEYVQGTSSALKRQALTKGMVEADMNEPLKNRSFDLGNGQTIPLSGKGMNQLKGFEKLPETSKAVQAYRAANKGAKATLLSLSEFHPINITRKAGSALLFKGHPGLAAQGAYDTFRSQIGGSFSDALQQRALKDGTVEFGARVGSPMKFGSDYATEGKLSIGKAGLGERTIFEKAMPSLHYRVLQGLKADLDKRGLAYDSTAAQAAGDTVNHMMGFVNTEVRNLSTRSQRALSDVALAPQFTRAKWNVIRDALTKGGPAGGYARSAVVGDSLTSAVTMLGIGFLAHQKSDDIKDLLLRSLFQPAVPTPWQDAKGNTIKLNMPATYASEALGLTATLQRGPDGHLHVNWNPQSIPSNVANYGRNRLASLPSAGLKVATNTDYAQRPLYDPNAPLGTKAEQAATTLMSGTLPIGGQGLVQTNMVKSHLPGPMQQVLNANSPGSNPVMKAIGSSFGLTPTTDTTVGKGQQTSQYFSALDRAKQGLNRQETDALDMYAGSKKNPVTGRYDVTPSVFDQPGKATNLLQNPKVIDNLIAMNKTLQSQGQKVDPLWLQPKDKIVKYLQYQTMPPGGPDAADWRNKNSWYDKDANSLYTQRNAFFSSLPPADPNKPKAPIEYPQPGGQTLADANKYYSIPDPAGRSQFLQAHPDVSSYMDNQAAYTNAVRVARGYGALRNYPTPSPYVQQKLDSMTGMTSKQKAQVYSDPQVAAWSQQDAVYNLTKGAGLSQIQGESPSSKTLGAAISLGYSIVKNPDGTYALKYPDSQGGTNAAAVQAGAKNMSGGSGSSANPNAYHVNIQPIKKPFIQAHKPFGENKVHTQTWNNRIKFAKSPTSSKIKTAGYSALKRTAKVAVKH